MKREKEERKENQSKQHQKKEKGGFEEEAKQNQIDKKPSPHSIVPFQ